MIFSQQAIFSDKQAVTSSAVSTNTLDFGERSTIPFTGTQQTADMGAGNKIPLGVFVTEDFVGATFVRVRLLGSDTASDPEGVLTSPVVIAETPSIPVGELKAGYNFNLDNFPTKTKQRYVQLNYVVAGTATAGSITAGIIGGKDEGH